MNIGSDSMHWNTRTARQIQIIKGDSRLVHGTIDYLQILEDNCYIWENSVWWKGHAFSWHLYQGDWQNCMCGKNGRMVISKNTISLVKEH